MTEPVTRPMMPNSDSWPLLKRYLNERIEAAREQLEAGEENADRNRGRITAYREIIADVEREAPPVAKGGVVMPQ